MTTIITEPFTFYHYYVCPSCKPITYFIKTNKIAYEEKHIDLRKREQRSEEYLSINPLGRVPSIVEKDGFILFESSTILRYLCNTRNVPDRWYPKDPKKRSQVDQFYDWFQNATKAIAAYLYSRDPECPIKVPVVENELELLEKTLEDLQKTFLRNRKYLTGDEMSIGDLQMIYFFTYLDRAKYELTKFPALKEWKDRILSSDIKLQEDYDLYIKESEESLAIIKKAAAEAKKAQ